MTEKELQKNIVELWGIVERLEKEYSERVKELRSELASVLTDFASTLFDNRIAKIDRTTLVEELLKNYLK